MSLSVLLPTDVFPPRTGGAGWSSHALATALIARGHRVTALVPQTGQAGSRWRDEQGVPVIDVGYRVVRVPFVANWMRFELFWPRFAAAIVAAAEGEPQGQLVIHGQHIQGIGGAVLAAQRLGVPAIATVRDHWPRHYFGTALHGDRLPLRDFGWAASATDLLARRGPLVGAASLLALPYMAAHMRRRRALLRQCAAVISLSDYITGRLRGIVAAERLHPIPNLVDLDAVQRTSAQAPGVAVPEQFILFAGKLARNKGAHLLPEIMAAYRHAGGGLPLVIAGGGDPRLLEAIRATGQTVSAFAWLDHADVLRLMARCAALVFPSTWGEPLSRVLLEACAVGVPIVAMPTGGTPDLLEHEVSALFAASAGRLGGQLARCTTDPALQAHLRSRVQLLARRRLSAPVVAAQLERVYQTCLEQQRPGG